MQSWSCCKYSVYLAFLAIHSSRFPPSFAKSVQFPSWGWETFNAARSLSLITLCAISDTWRNDRSSIDAAKEDEKGGAGVGGILSCSFVAIFMLIRQWMGLVGRFACYAVSLLATYSLLSASPPGVSQLRGALDYDEAGFMLQLWHKGICEAWLASTISSTTRLYLLAHDELWDLNFRGCAIARYIVTRRIIVDAVDSEQIFS